VKYLSALLFLILLVCSTTAYAGSTQTNVSGSNTAIEGGYTGGATTYESGSSSSSTTNNTSNSDIRSAPPSAGAPSYNSMTQDVCAVGASAGLQTFGVGVSAGKHFIDKNCERLKLARILNDFGMKVGKEASKLWEKYEFERPDYKAYVKRMKLREKVKPVINTEPLPADTSTNKKVSWTTPK
jgi:hypothetical protein